MEDSQIHSPLASASRNRWFWVVWAVCTVFCMWFEVLRFHAATESPVGPLSWFFQWDPETTLPLAMLLLLPLLAILTRAPCSTRTTDSVDHAGLVNSPSLRPVGLRYRIPGCIVLFALSITASLQVATVPVSVQTSMLESRDFEFSQLPPAFHDESSYLLQAETYLAGKLSWPAMDTRPDLFHQFHVLNEHRTASRYFPWTGAWMAPFVALDHPLWGHWLAGGLSTVFFYLSLLQLVCGRAAFVGALLIAVSPGIALFSNLLLAHHPVMLALSVFLWAFLRMMATASARYAVMAGVGLACAMLGRPMTAAGFALPFGCWMLVQLLHQSRRVEFARLTLWMGMPLMAGLIVLGICNHEVTGSWSRTAYQEYTEKFTPRHRFGFNNAPAAASAAPDFMTAYDQWAKNLTGHMAVSNVWNRLTYSVLWSLGIIPVLYGMLHLLPGLMGKPGGPRKSGLQLMACAVVTLHLVHLPYWFDGIMHWHYVFETAPLILMLTGIGLVIACERLSRMIAARWALTWTALLVAVVLLPGWTSSETLWGTSKVHEAVSEQSFARTRKLQFQLMTESAAADRRIVVMVDESRSDPQLSYVINPPRLDSAVLVCRRPTTLTEIEELQHRFADRNFYSFDPETFKFSEWEAPDSGK